MSVYEALNIVGRDSYLPFSYDEWKAGYSFFVFNMTPDRAGAMHFPDQKASLRLDLTFDPAPTTPVTIVLYAVFDANIIIAADGIVTTDFSMWFIQTYTHLRIWLYFCIFVIAYVLL